VTPRLTLVTNANSGNQSLYITAELSPVIISPIMSYFKESLIVFTSVIIINSSFYFSSLFNSAKLFKSGLL
jgi:type VI protein secretion system component Hcp